jgi:crossover junction endodeoxyribonuclease RuvC
MKIEPLRILGIDPGTNITGYGLVEIRNNKPVILDMGKITPKKGLLHYDRIKVLHEESLKIVEKYRPDVMAIEAPFFGKDIQAMLKLGRAQGVIMVAALMHNVPIHEYAPLLVKQSITGMGRASKEQVAYFLQKVYHLTELPETTDVTDAIAVAICHYIQLSRPQQKSEFKNWGDFIKKNPGRIK